MDKKPEGWTPPDEARLQRDFFVKHGDDSYTRGIDRKWRTLGRLIKKGARIRDGRLGV